jgi:glycerol-3-phosphate dehydrogenase (NAD(P)+)
MCDGLSLGDNAKALLIARGLSEMARFGVLRGAEVLTFGGLAGIGDVIATCASNLSRNHQTGERLGRGEPIAEILASIHHVVEGVHAARAVSLYANRAVLDLPIVQAVYAVVHENRPIKEALAVLMDLPTGDELAALRVR